MEATLASPDFSKRIPQLDGLRGLAIGMVIYFHYITTTFGSSRSLVARLLTRSASLGWTGVDLFFVLSGFLIGGILMDARGSANYFRVFYSRRACRIFPVYFTFVALTLLGAALLRWPMFAPSIPWPFQASFTQNLWMAAHNTLGSRALWPTWSLAVEEQFYLLLPLLVYAVKPSRLPWIAGAGIAGAAVIRLGLLLIRPNLVIAAYTLLPCRMNALLMGTLAAWFIRQPRLWQKLLSKRNDLRRALLILLGCLPLFLAIPAIDSRFEILVGLNAFPVYYALLLVASLADERIGRILRVRWLMNLGGIAYFVYLVHYPMFGLLIHAMGVRTAAGGIVAAIIALPLTIVVAQVSWKWFEKPFIRLGHKVHYSGRRKSEFQRIAHVATPEPAVAE